MDKKTSDTIMLNWDNINENQRNTVKENVLGWKVIGFIIPSIYLLWSRSYMLFVLDAIIELLFISQLYSRFILIEYLLVFVMIIIRIFILARGAKWAFNNSCGYLRNLFSNGPYNYLNKFYHSKMQISLVVCLILLLIFINPVLKALYTMNIYTGILDADTLSPILIVIYIILAIGIYAHYKGSKE